MSIHDFWKATFLECARNIFPLTVKLHLSFLAFRDGWTEASRARDCWKGYEIQRNVKRHLRKVGGFSSVAGLMTNALL